MPGEPHSSTDQDREVQDADLVNDAIGRIQDGDSKGAERILHDVLQRAPQTYQRDTEKADGSLIMRFWDQTEFLHFVTLHGQRLGRTIIWRAAAYPRAFYYLGFLRVKQQRPAEAVEFLDAGLVLEPRNAKLRLEKAKAIGLMGDRKGQLRLAQEVVDMGDEIPGAQRALAMRSAGFALIEMGDLDAAERWFHRSLELDPDNVIAHNELEYVADLRRGGEHAPVQMVSTGGDQDDRCAQCGEKLASKGTVLNRDGQLLFFCDHCDGKPAKKWWEFWK